MKSYRKVLLFNIPTRHGFVNITPRVEEAPRESGIREGLCLVNAMLVQFRLGLPALACESPLPSNQPDYRLRSDPY